jgi:hypothetical protein
VEPPGQSSHVCMELHASLAHLQIFFNASLAFSDPAITCAIVLMHKLCDLVVCAIARKPPLRTSFNSAGRFQTTLRICGIAYTFRGYVLDVRSLHIYQLDLSPIGCKVTALAVVPHSCGHSYFFSQHQMAIGVGTCAYRPRGNVQGHANVISPVTQSAPECRLI